MSEKSKKRGRPRSESTDISILKATRALMMESGINNFSMDDVAARAGVSKPTIYLRWKTKEELLSDAFGMAADQTVIPDTGNALADLRVLCWRICCIPVVWPSNRRRPLPTKWWPACWNRRSCWPSISKIS
ncbi:TetR/AcrR family transcriptional regulator [Paenibacillus sp. P26]|nr:TetR/AcrR family transcriptional regulator [Paenibacillus sp. P26]